MSLDKLLEISKQYEIEKVKQKIDLDKDFIAFTGTPQKHPHDNTKIIIVMNPFSTHTIFYEFSLKDIKHVEELPSVVDMKGHSIKIVKIWVRKGSYGLKYEPFVVADTMNYFEQAFNLTNNP